MPGVLEARDRPEQTVGGHGVLREVVRADRGEVGDLQHTVGHERRRGHLDHDTGSLDAVLLREGDEIVRLLDGRDHRRHDPEVGLGRRVGVGERRQLLAQDVLARAEGPEAPQAQRRVVLVRVVEEGERLVGPGIQRPHDHLLAGEGLQQLGVGLRLLLDGRCLRGGEEEELGAEQAHALGAEFDRLGGAAGLAEVRQERDGRAVLQCAGRDGGGCRGRPRVGTVLRLRQLVGGRVGRHDALGGVDDDDVTVDEVLRARDAHDRDDRLLAGEDRGVRGGTALGGDEGQHLVEVEQGGVGGGEVLRDEHERVAGVGDARRGQAAQPRDDTLGDVVEVGGALAEVAAHRREGVAEAREGVVDGELTGLAGVHPGLDLGVEGGVLRHHPLRLEHLAGHAAGVGAALLELAGDGGDRLAHPGELLLRSEGARGIRRRRQRLRHPGDRPLGHPQSDPDSTQLCHLFVSFGFSSRRDRWSAVRRACRAPARRCRRRPRG